MLRSIGVSYLDVPELSRIEGKIRKGSHSLGDRLVRIKVEAYSSKSANQADELRINTNAKIDSVQHELCKLIESPSNKRERDKEEELVGEEEDGAVKRSRSDEQAEEEARMEDFHNLKLGFNVVPYIARSWKKSTPTRNMFKNLVLILNQSFSDYDFGSVVLEQFERKPMKQVTETVFGYFNELNVSEQQKALWKELEEVIGLPVIDPDTKEVVRKTLEGIQVYSYLPENEQEIDADPLSGLGNLWSFNYFFCNPTGSNVVFVACSCRPRKFSQCSDTDAITLQNSFLEAWDESDDYDDDAPSSHAKPSLGVTC